MADLKISELSSLSGSDLVAADELAIVDDSASETKRITVSNLIANGVTLISDDAIPGAKILFGAGDITTAALADSAVTSAKIGADQVTATKIADNTIVNLVSDLPTSGDYTGQLALDTDDNSLYVYSGSAWLNTKAPGSVNSFTDTTLGIINISTVVSSGTATITASIDNTASAAQFLAGPVGAGGTVGYRTIDGGDLPTATTTSKGGVIVNGGGLTVSTDTIQIDNSVTASSIKHLVTYDANGLITGGAAITSSDLPVATNLAKGAVSVPTNEGLAVDANGNLSIDNTVTAGTYTKVTVTSKGVVSAGDVLTAADIPDHSATKLTSGTINSSRIASGAITAAKLADQSTTKFGGALGSNNVTIFPSGDFKGQFFYDETTQDLYIFTGSAFVPVTVLSGNLVNAGAYNASTNQMSSVTSAGSAAGFSAGAALPAPAVTNLNHYVVVDTSGTGSGAAPAVALAPPDMLLSQGVGTEYSLIDVSNAIAGQTASNISLIAAGNIIATDVQAGIQELDTEKLPKAGGTMTGNLNFGTSTNVVFEGSSADEYETTLTVTDPTADRTITLPDVTGTVVTTGDTSSVTSTMIDNGTIVNADINDNAEIAVSKLANGTARQLLQTDAGGSSVEFTSNVDVPGTLDVTSAATFDSTVDVTGLLSANGKLAYPAGTAAAVSLYSGSDTDTGIYSPGSDQFGIATAGTSRIVIDANGNTGIGTTSPSDYSSSADDLVIAGSGQKGITIASTNSTQSNIFFADSTSGSGEFAGYLAYIHGSDAFAFGANGSERMRIDSSGNVGIGTLSPTEKLSVDGKLHITNDIIMAQTNGRVDFDNGNSNGALRFHSTSANAERMRIDSSGNVGIGTLSPQRLEHLLTSTDTQLRVESTSASSNNEAAVELIRGSNQSAIKNKAGGLEFFTGGLTSERLRIDSSGRVGIGTSSPGKDLDVNNGSSNCTIRARTGIGFSSFLSLQPNGSGSGVALTANADSSAQLFNQLNSHLAFGTNNTERMQINSNGKVLIGTTSNYANANADDLVIGSNSSSAESGITLGSTNGSGIRFADSDNQSAGVIEYFHADNSMRLFTSGSERMRIDSSGNVGIGTTNISSKLTVNGTLRFQTGNNPLALLTGDGDGTNCFKIDSNSAVNNDSGLVRVFNNGTQKARIDGDGSFLSATNNYGTLSDVSLKENIVDANPQWADIKNIQVRNFNFKESVGHGTFTQLGVIAQEVESVSPGLVKIDSDGVKSVKYSVLYMKAVKALQEAMDRIETLEAKVAALEAG